MIFSGNETTPFDCSSPWQVAHRSCVRYMTDFLLDWDAARETCLSLGADLISFNNVQEVVSIIHTFSKKSTCIKQSLCVVPNSRYLLRCLSLALILGQVMTKIARVPPKNVIICPTLFSSLAPIIFGEVICFLYLLM